MRNQPNTATATDVKNRFGDYLQSVLTKHEPLLIKKHGKPIAVILDYENWKQSTRPKKKIICFHG
ncbi:MAG: type II toxin-antitoxin system Phd/YefM family antitoxin [Deltaproteobacteria bacterium]|nr:MAG: type II toxin-antitoxin system Phd/YefM family antitoxin [Deltaproteobacteria bacterium]